MNAQKFVDETVLRVGAWALRQDKADVNRHIEQVSFLITSLLVAPMIRRRLRKKGASELQIEMYMGILFGLVRLSAKLERLITETRKKQNITVRRTSAPTEG